MEKKLTVKDQLEIAETSLDVAKEAVYEANLACTDYEESRRLRILYYHVTSVLLEIRDNLKKYYPKVIWSYFHFVKVAVS